MKKTINMLIVIIFIFVAKYSISQPFLISDPPIEDNIDKYYIRCYRTDPNMYDIDPNDQYSILMPIDPNEVIVIKDGFHDPNFYLSAHDDGSLKLNLKDVKPNISYSLLIQACSDKICGCSTLVSFIPVHIPRKIKNIKITKEGCNYKYLYIIIQ